MITLALNSTTHLNVSLQVGDLIYVQTTTTQTGAEDAEGINTTGSVNILGVLVSITFSSNRLELLIDNAGFSGGAQAGDFIMFSKYDQSMGDLIGYYAKVKFVNDSLKKAEIFSVGSEVVINSK